MKQAIALSIIVLATPGAAQELSLERRLEKLVEMPGHRALINEIARPETKLAPFETDGCSGGMSTSWRVVADILPDFKETHQVIPPWEECCVTHDRAYHNASDVKNAEDSFDARLAADEALRRCVIAQGETRRDELAQSYQLPPETIDRAYRTIAESMFNAVRFGGGPCSGLSWRWGYGYPGCIPVLGTIIERE